MGRNETEIVLSASETKLIQGLRRGETAIKNYGQKAMEVFRRTGAVINHVSDRYLTRFNTLLGGAGIAMAGRAVIDFDSKLARLGIQAGKSGAQMMQLKKELFATAIASNQAPTALLEGMAAIVERTGNFDFAVKSLKDMGIVASATGANMEAIGATASNMQEKMGILPEQIMPVFDVLNEQGKQGAFTLQNMATMFERLLSAANRFDVQGVDGMRRFGAFLQIARRGTGSSEEATTAVENTFADIMSKADKLQGAGIQIIDPKKSKAAGRQMFRDFDLVLKDIIKKTNGDMLVLQEIFEIRSMRAITPLVQSWKKFGDFREFEQFVKMGGDGKTIMQDYAKWTQTTAAQMENFRTQLSKFANTNLAAPIRMLTAALTELNKHPIFTNAALWTLIGLTGAMGVAKFARGLGGLFGKGAGGIAGGLGKMSAPMPVYVVNKHLSMLPGAGWGFPGGGLPNTPGGAAGGAKGLLSKAGKYILPVAIPLTAYEWMKSRQAEARGENDLVTPSANWFNKKNDLPALPKGFDPMNPANAFQNHVNLSITVDKSGRVSTVSDDTKTKVNLPRGRVNIGD